MTATGQNFTIYQGDDKEIFVTTYDENDVILDITNCTLNWVVYRRYPENIVLTKITGSGITITDPTNGIFRVDFDPNDTLSLLGEYNHECELTDTNLNISTLLVGTMNVYKSKA